MILRTSVCALLALALLAVTGGLTALIWLSCCSLTSPTHG